MLQGETQEIQGVQVYHISFLLATIDLDMVMDLEEHLNCCLQKCTSSFVILDIHNVNYLDSSALGVLLRFSRNLHTQNKQIALVGANQAISLILKLTQSQDILQSFSNSEVAVKNYIQQL